MTDSNGCTDTCYKEVTVYDLPDCTITADPGVCAYSEGNNANTTSGYAGYSWSVVSGPGTITSGSNSSSITWDAQGAGSVNFSVTVTDSNGCTDTCYKEVTVYDLPDCTITADPGVCAYSEGNNANTTSGYAGYSWSVVSGPGTITSGSNTSAIKWNAQGTGSVNFSVTVTDSNGCTDTCYKEVTVYDLPDCTITADPGVCAYSEGNNANTTSGYAGYSWSVVSGPGTITSGSNSSTITWNAQGPGTVNISVTVTDSNSCTDTCYKEVTVYDLPDCTITADPGVCAYSVGNKANTTSGYAGYSWSVVSGPATITSGSNTSSITWNAQGPGTVNISVTVTDSNSCTDTCYKEVTVYDLPDCTINSDGGVCAYSEGNIANTTSGYVSYSWSVVSGPATITPGSNSDTITWNALGPGSVNFSVSVTDSNGCNNTCYKDPVTVYDLPDCSITAKSGVCAYSEGNTANTTSGYASYSWSVVSGPGTITSGSNSSAITWSAGGLGTVNFSVTVIDRSNCTNTCFKEIEVYDLPDCTITAEDVCAYSEGNAASTISGYASYSWSVVSGPGTITSGWNTSAITWNAGDPGTVNFSVTVTDESDCTATCYKVVTVYQNPTVDAGPDRYIYGFDSSVVLSPNVTGGMPDYAYVWTDQGVIINKDGAENVSVSTPGTYVINVTDENGCSGIDSVNVIELVPDIEVTKTASPNSGSSCTNVTFTITVTNTGEVPLNLEVTDTIPAGMSYVSANPSPDSVIENSDGTWTVVWESELDVLDPGNSTQILLVAHIDDDILDVSTNNALTVLGSSEDEVLRIQQVGGVTPEKIQELELMRDRLEIELEKMIELRGRFDKDAADLKDETPPIEGTGYTVLNYTNPLTGESLVLFEDGEGNVVISEYTNPELNAVLTSEYGPGDVLISDSYLSRDGMEGLRIEYDLPYAGYKTYTVTNYNTGDSLIDTFDLMGNLSSREYRRTPGIPKVEAFKVRNCVTAIGTFEGGQVSSSACADVTIKVPDIVVTKTASPTSGSPCTNVTFTIVVTNTGEVSLDPVVTDTIPAGMSYVSANPAPDSVIENTDGTWTVVWESNLNVLGPGNSTQILLVAHIDEDIPAADSVDGVLTVLGSSEDEVLRIQQASGVTPEKIQELEWMKVRLDIELRKMIELRGRFDKDAAILKNETPPFEVAGYTILNYTNPLTGESLILFEDREGNLVTSEYKNPELNAVLTTEYGPGDVLISESYLSMDGMEGLRIDYDSPYAGYKTYTVTNYNTGDTLIDTFDARDNLVNREYRRTPGIARESIFTLRNCVTVVGTTSGGSKVSASACADVTVIYRSDLKLTKTPSPTTATVGTVVLYTYLVENNGNTTISNLVLFDDMLNQFVSLNRTVLKPGEFAEGMALYTVVSEDLPGPLVNNATVTGTDPQGTEVTDMASATVPLYYSQIDLIKTPDKTVVAVGDLITYTYIVTNVGTTTISNLTLFDDKINQYLNLSKTTLAPNETATATGEYTALPEDMPGPVLNNATVEGTDEKDAPVSAEDDASVDILQGLLNVTKTANRTVVRPGEEVTYTIAICNDADVEANYYDVIVNDTFDRDVEFVSADPSPKEWGDRWQRWELGDLTIPAKSCYYITLVVRTLKTQNFTFDMDMGVEGVGFVNVANDYRTAPPPYILTNYVYVYYYLPADNDDRGPEVVYDIEKVLVRELGTELETREHGSGTYESEEVVHMRTENKSISMDKDMAATYGMTTLGLYNNRSVTYSSKWTEDAKAKNWITGASLTETYRYADFIDRESSFFLDENGSVMEFETEFSGMGHFGALKKADPNDTARDTPTFELDENYLGTFRIYEKVDEYGKNVEYESSSSGEGTVAGDRRVGDSQRSYEHGSGSYDSEGQISTVTNYMAKDISLVYAPTSQNLTDDVSVDSNVKWKEGMYSRTKGISYIGEEYTSIDRLEKESIFRGLNDLATESDFSGTARYRVMLGDITGNDTENLTGKGPSGAMIDFDEIYSGDYSIAKRIVLTGVPKYDRPHLSVVKTSNTESGSSLVEYAITVTNDGNVVLDTITVEDRLPQGTEFMSASLRPSEITSDRIVWDNILSLPIGRTVNIDLVLNVTDYSGHLVNVVKATAQHGENVTISASNFSVLDPSWLSCCPSEIFASKTATVDSVLQNVVTYRLTVQNLAESPVVARIDDEIPGGMKLLGYSAMPSEYDESSGRITWVVTDLAPGELRTIDYLVEAMYDGRYVNVARIDPYTLDGQELSQVTVSSVVLIGPFEGAQVPPGWVPPDWDLEYYSYDCVSGMSCEEISF